jgi:predicted transposase/invertase (TIGR01784 family)
MKEIEYGKYMNLKTDFAFKTVFGNEKEKGITISFLNEILQGRDSIVDIQFLPPEQLGDTDDERKAIFDIYCRNEWQERFVVEMQVVKQKYFIDRSLYYATFPIQKQAVKGKWNYRLEPLYIITILDFVQWENNRLCVNYHSLMNEETHEIISRKLQFITIELPKFNKNAENLKTGLDCWLFCFKHLSKLNERPPEIQGETFNKLFELTEINKLTRKDMETYTKSIYGYHDVELGMEYSREQGFEKGMEKGFELTAKNLQQMGFSINDIVKATGLTPEQIRKLND